MIVGRQPLSDGVRQFEELSGSFVVRVIDHQQNDVDPMIVRFVVKVVRIKSTQASPLGRRRQLNRIRERLNQAEERIAIRVRLDFRNRRNAPIAGCKEEIHSTRPGSLPRDSVREVRMRGTVRIHFVVDVIETKVDRTLRPDDVTVTHALQQTIGRVATPMSSRRQFAAGRPSMKGLVSIVVECGVLDATFDHFSQPIRSATTFPRSLKVKGEAFETPQRLVEVPQAGERNHARVRKLVTHAQQLTTVIRQHRVSHIGVSRKLASDRPGSLAIDPELATIHAIIQAGMPD